MQLLWIFNSGFFGVTRTSMSNFNSYLAGSQDKCIFWLFKNEFPERISNFLFRHSKVALKSTQSKINSIKVNLIKVHLMKHFSVWYITNSQCVQLPVGRALHRYRRGHRFESRSGLNYLSCVYNCDDQS